MPDRSIVHTYALAGATIAGSSPPMVSISPLIVQEVLMVIKIAELFGEKISESEAKAVYKAAGCTRPGSWIFEAVNAGYPFTIPVKVTITACILEAAGNLVFDYYESKYGKEEWVDKTQNPD